MRIKNILIGLFIFTNTAFSQSSAAFWLAGGEEQVLPIATNGLIAYYDASNVDSYDPANPGSTWNDLSGNNYHVTNYGATHSTDNDGVFYFDGVDDYMVYEGDINEDVMTFSIWTKVSNITTNCIIDLDDINLTNDLNQELLFFNGISNDQFAIQSELSGTYELTGNSSYVINENIWYYITFTYNSGTYNLYINNVLISTTTDPSADLGAFDFFFNGYIGELFFYDRVLTSQELTDNYNATKERYTTCDEYYYNTSLLLHMDGSNGSTVFTDNSINNFTVTANGNAQISTAQSKFGGASGYFDGVGDYITAPASSEFSFNGDFTIEGWINTSVYTIDTKFRRVIATGPDASTSIQLLFFNGSAASSNLSVYSNTMLIAGTIPVATGEWVHFALSRVGTSLKLFINGVQSGSTATTSTNFSGGATYGVWLGRYIGTSGGHFDGYMDDIRITKGVARYTSNFTPPTEPFGEIICDPLWDGTQTSLLDDYSGAAAAYSVRALNSNYTGPLMTIRRASDNAETDVYALANGDLDEAWINSFCTGTTCYVKTWYDQSGNGHNATQLTPANQPTIYTGGAVVAFNNRPAIDFDGSNDFFNTPPLDVFSGSFIPNTSFAVFRREATSTIFLGFGHNSLTAPYSPTMYYDDKTYLFSRRGGWAYYIYSNQNQNLFTGEEPASGNLSIYVNGLLGASQYNAQTRTMSDFYNTIGRLASDYSNSKTQELIFYQNVFNSTDRSGIESNINSYYSIY